MISPYRKHSFTKKELKSSLKVICHLDNAYGFNSLVNQGLPEKNSWRNELLRKFMIGFTNRSYNTPITNQKYIDSNKDKFSPNNCPKFVKLN